MDVTSMVWLDASGLGQSKGMQEVKGRRLRHVALQVGAGLYALSCKKAALISGNSGFWKLALGKLTLIQMIFPAG